jgi:hypothetical protein
MATATTVEQPSAGRAQSPESRRPNATMTEIAVVCNKQVHLRLKTLAHEIRTAVHGSVTPRLRLRYDRGGRSVNAHFRLFLSSRSTVATMKLSNTSHRLLLFSTGCVFACFAGLVPFTRDKSGFLVPLRQPRNASHARRRCIICVLGRRRLHPLAWCPTIANGRGCGGVDQCTIGGAAQPKSSGSGGQVRTNRHASATTPSGACVA